MLVHKLEVYVLDTENWGIDNVVIEMEQIDYFSATVKTQETIEIDDDEWSDDHPLNNGNISLEKFRSYFK